MSVPDLHASFDRFARRSTQLLSSPWAFMVLILATSVWLMIGWWVSWHESWQITYTTILTIMTQGTAMLVLYAQRVEEWAMQRKLDELIRAIAGADNDLRGIEGNPDA